MTRGRSEQLTGWGLTTPSRATVFDVSADTAAAVLDTADTRGVIARGLGRSYGDPAQNGGGTVLRLQPGPDPIRLDSETGIVTADAAVSVDALIRYLMPRGFFVPVTPGTRFVTLGGAIAGDVHGKNHHVDGSWGQALRSLRILMADGAVRDVDEASDPQLWWATIGGMGLTGVVVDATFATIPVASSRCVVDTERTGDLDGLMAAMDEGDHRYRYSVAWIDLMATGAHLGRGVLTRGDHATSDQAGARGGPQAYRTRRLGSVPKGLPNLLVPGAVRLFNQVWFGKAPRQRTGQIQTIGRFFHPLDGVGNWNRLYGRHGFVQYQFVVPFGAEDALRSIVEKVATSGQASFLAVLKRFGEANPAPLSFPKPGWTLTLDLAAGRAGLGRLLHELDDIVLGAGGRHYLAKDAHATPDAIRQGYPRLGEWQEARAKADPHGIWVSDQARRLELVA